MSKVIIKYKGDHMQRGPYEVSREHALSLVGNPDWELPKEFFKVEK